MGELLWLTLFQSGKAYPYACPGISATACFAHRSRNGDGWRRRGATHHHGSNGGAPKLKDIVCARSFGAALQTLEIDELGQAGQKQDGPDDRNAPGDRSARTLNCPVHFKSPTSAPGLFPNATEQFATQQKAVKSRN